MKEYPLIKYVVAFIIGIALNQFFPIPLTYYVLIGIILLLIIILRRIKLFNNKRRYIEWLFFLLVIFVGSSYSTFRKSEVVEYPFKENKIKNVTLWGEIKNINLLSNDKLKVVLSSDSISVDTLTQRINGNILCSISFKSENALHQLFDKIKIGNGVKLKGVIRKGREERNPGEFDYYKYLQSKNISALLNVYKVSDFKIVNSKSNYLLNLVFKARKAIANSIDKFHNKKTAALLKGLLLADRSDIDFGTKESFINSGVIHVLAVSGLHVGFIILIFSFLFSRISLYPRIILTIIGIILFLIITNSPASVFRATIMVVVMLLMFLSNRDYNSVNALAMAALVLLLINPNQLFTPGFQLSFSAVLSILILYPILREKIKTKNKFLKYLLLFIAVSFSAQIGTLPFVLVYFNKLSIISIFANLLVIPLIGAIVALGVTTLFVGIFTTLGALYFASANMLITDLLLYIVDITGHLQFSYLFIPNFSFFDSLLFYSLLVLIFASFSKFKNKYAFVLLLLLAFANFYFYSTLDDKELLPKDKLSVVMIDIGQGDAIFIKFPNGKTALIDAGNSTIAFDNGERIIIPLLKKLGVEKIDYGFITHVDSDHYKGFLSLIKNGWIKNIYKPRLDSTLKKDVRLEKIIDAGSIPKYYYSKNEMIFDNIRFYILNDTTDAYYSKLDMNNRSGVFKLVYGNTSFLFTGDAEHSVEKYLIKHYGEFLNSDILKVGHHGSNSGSSQNLIDMVTPDIALISAGVNNKFGHPAKPILDRLVKNKIKIFRTDLEGAIILQSDGEVINKIEWRDF